MATTILLVDDEGLVRNLLKLVLTNHGYLPLVAASGVEAIETAVAFPGRIDLLLTDVQMPGMGGVDLAAALAETRPDARVIFITGDAGNYVDQLKGRTVLRKPFDPRSLVSLIQHELAVVGW